jgi:hypothetical protein
MKRGFIIAIITGLIIVVLLLILLLTTGGSDPPQTSEDCAEVSESRIQSCCNDWAVGKGLPIPDCEGKWRIENNQCSYVCTEAPSVNEGCADVAPDQQHICCERWAQENDIIHIACAGQWKVVRGECEWVCSE